MTNYSNIKKTMTILVLLSVTVLGTWAQTEETYLTDKTRPDCSAFIADPPQMTDDAFYNDFYYYQWGKEQRKTDAANKSVYDAHRALEDSFSEAFGMPISEQQTPEIFLFVKRLVNDIELAKRALKKKYKRLRPFVVFNEPTLLPEEDQERASSYSYPSGHAARGWGVALALCTVAPERTTQLMNRANEYGTSRIISGHHWKSDIDAGKMVALSIYSNVVALDSFQKQLKKAITEYTILKSNIIDTTRTERTIVISN